MNELNETQKKIAAIITGVGILVIGIPLAWNSYQEYQQRENARKVCEELVSLRKELIERLESGNITPLEAAGLYQLGFVNMDCKDIH